MEQCTATATWKTETVQCSLGASNHVLHRAHGTEDVVCWNDGERVSLWDGRRQ
jgi:hypothetical protein